MAVATTLYLAAAALLIDGCESRLISTIGFNTVTNQTAVIVWDLHTGHRANLLYLPGPAEFKQASTGLQRGAISQAQ